MTKKEWQLKYEVNDEEMVILEAMIRPFISSWDDKEHNLNAKIISIKDIAYK